MTQFHSPLDGTTGAVSVSGEATVKEINGNLYLNEGFGEYV